MKKLTIMILFIIFCFSFFLLSYFKTRNYELTYKVNDYTVKEKFSKKDNKYIVSINYNKKDFIFIIDEKYHRARKLVDRVKKYKNEDEVCFEISFNKKNVLPRCISNDEFISYYLTSNKMKSKIGKKKYKTRIKTNKFNYKNIEVNSLNDKKIFIWNYHGFYYLNDKKNINITRMDVYNPYLLGQIESYLIIPDYDQGYEYNKLKLLNVNSLKLSNFELDESISNESYVLGINDKSIFIFDKKYEKEYEIVPYKSKYRQISPMIYENGKQISKSSTSLSTKEQTFTYDNLYKYLLKNNKIYRKSRYSSDLELISNKDIKEIVYQNEYEVYYISNDKLYMYSDKYGENLILEYFELNFNYKNIIYIFD